MKYIYFMDQEYTKKNISTFRCNDVSLKAII
uniref:Uncharacterized protein n=1 Tax=Anguilla anguilla TaxID=7936 RepID=A0A0E9U2E9_ANGAN